MNIGQAERACGLPAKTIRYYEDVGLVTPDRRANGYRTYQELDLHKLKFLQRARGLGFSVEDCRALLALYDDKERASADVKAIAEAHLARIDQKLAELATLRSALTTLVDACHGDHRPDCPIIDDLAGG
ncbi:MAG: Cu(I)-responsive transcriptional regulator [Alphaproteobacteria bacterium]|jgi:Cu(I)-responsive transcriptional regulator